MTWEIAQWGAIGGGFAATMWLAHRFDKLLRIFDELLAALAKDKREKAS